MKTYQATKLNTTSMIALLFHIYTKKVQGLHQRVIFFEVVGL